MIARILCFQVLLALSCAHDASGQFTLTNGTHVITTDIDDALLVMGDAEVTFASGARARSIEVRDDACLYMTGGELTGSLHANGGRSFVSGGAFNLAGVLTSGIFATDGGDGVYVRVENVSPDVVDCSTPWYPQASGTATVDFVSGTAKAVWTRGNGLVNIHGGDFSTGVALEADGVINIHGGSFSSFATISGGTWDGGIVNVYGSSFNYPFGTIEDESGLLIGTLQDWNPAVLEFLPEDLSYGRRTATITLHQTPGLLILYDEDVTIRWPTNAVGSTIESVPSLGTGSTWTTVSEIPQVVGGYYTLTNSSQSDSQFYRLVGP